MAEEQKIQNKDEDTAADFGLNIDEMAKAGLQYGHKSSKTHPEMKPYISGVKNTVHLIDLEKTVEKFNLTLNFVKEIISQGKTLLLIGTKIQVKNLVRDTAKECGLHYVHQRWLGGTFTNFETVLKRIGRLKDLEKEKGSGGFDKYTKKERLGLEKLLNELQVKFEGITEMTKLPDAIFVVDMLKDDTAIREARKKRISIIGIADTNVNPALAGYFIPANDDAVSSVKYILDKIKKVILKTKEEVASKKQE